MSDSKQTEVQSTPVTEAGVSDNKTQVPEEVSTPKTFTQSEFNDAMASVRKKAEASVLKKFDGVDVDKYRALLTKEEEQVLEEQKKRGEFEKILKETAEKKDQRINQLHTQLNSIKVDDAIISSSAKYKAISPAQVSQLIKNQVKLNETGDPLTVDTLVKEFLDTNPHFISAGPSGSGAKSNTSTTGIGTVDITSLDMNKPEDRAIYAEYRKRQGIVK